MDHMEHVTFADQLAQRLVQRCQIAPDRADVSHLPSRPASAVAISILSL